jgi:hypothetical protein
MHTNWGAKARILLKKGNKENGENGAGDESRTRDLNLGKVALYQLSYSRIRLEARIGILHTQQGLSRQIFGKFSPNIPH